MDKNFVYPITVKMSSKAMGELHSCEYGSYEDHIDWRMIDGKLHRAEPYHEGLLHIVEIIERDKRKTKCELRSQEEVDEFIVQMSTGTFSIYHPRVATRLYEELFPYASEEARERSWWPTGQ